MRNAHRIGIAVVAAALALAPGAGRAGDPAQPSADPPVDEGLLEFLGSVDPSTDATQPDDGSWLAYLAQINIGKAAKASQVPQAPEQAKPASPPPSAGKPSG
jgi:hypothetical protein